MNLEIPNKRRWFEIIAAILTGLGKILIVDIFDRKLYFIVIAILFWLGYILWRKKQMPEILNYWGFDWSTFPKRFKQLLPIILGLIVLFYGIGYARGTLIVSWHIIPILLIYPIWGVIQQLLVVGLVAGNLQDMQGINLSQVLIIGITATLFAIVHFPSILLIGGTFLLAIVYTLLYLKERQLLVLGLFHGWLGCFFYFFVLGRDPWEEVFGILFGS